MGQFSWITSDTKRAILHGNAVRPPFPVYMLMPDGTNHLERRYEGYGMFGGKDYYVALAELNLYDLETEGLTARNLDEQTRRDLGINLEFMEPDTKASDYNHGLIKKWLEAHKPADMRKPKFAEKLVAWDSLPNSEYDPAQGTGYDPDEEEE